MSFKRHWSRAEVQHLSTAWDALAAGVIVLKCTRSRPCVAVCAAGDDGADALAAAVAASSSLKKVNLAGNAISAAQLDVVLHVLKTREYRL